MIRFVRCVFVVIALAAAPAAHAQLAQLALTPAAAPIDLSETGVPGELHGTIHDDRGQPLVGAIVSALGSTSVFAISDGQGRFAFRNLPAGAYLVRAHLQGYLPARGRVLQVNAGTRQSSTIALTRRADAKPEPTPVVEAAVGGGPDAAPPAEDGEEHGHDEVAWRMRHLKRSVLKDAQHAIAALGRDGSVLGDSFSGLGRAVGGSARVATSIFADLPLSGQFNLLTTTSFHRPEDLFAFGADAPRGVAFLSLEAPGAHGDWRVRGTITQGDIASWILAASYKRHEPAAHRYEAGVSYSTQRYLGGNAEALAAIRDGSRNVGSIYAYDDWAVVRRVHLGYGAKYARHDYMVDRDLLSPRASVTVQPLGGDPLRVRATVAHRETAAGAEEFLPPTVGLWLPPERTFSHVSRGSFRPERLDRIELAAEREWAGAVLVGVRAFRHRVEDQVVTVFGLGMPDVPASVGHYQVGSAGDYEARGWGISVSRDVATGVRAAVDYTVVESERRRASPDEEALEPLAALMLPADDRIHDLTASVESLVPRTATRVFVLYKLNTGFAPDAPAVAAARFNVQVNQALPFLNFTSAQWEMLVAVSNVFREEVAESSVYDELFVVRPPKRVLGGVTVRF
jgi:hypothetical protein